MPPLNSTLTLDQEEMRRLGYGVVDLLVEHWQGLSEKPVAHDARPAELRSLLKEPVPRRGSDLDSVLKTVSDQVFCNISHVDHPRFLGFIPSPSNFVSVMADALVAGTNVFSGSWISGAGAAVLEEITIDWLSELCGFPDTAGGLFVSGGSMANLTALAVARQERLGDRSKDAVVYFSDQTHSSVERALKVLGFEASCLRKLPSDSEFRLDLDALDRAMASDLQSGRRPFCVIANAGTTNTGAVDPLSRIAELCRRESLWFHVDGAYGAAAVLSERGRSALVGIEEADSLALDPHKWLFQPYEVGCVLVKRREWLTDTFRIMPEYLHDTRREEQAINYCDFGVQLTRSFRALKLWMSFKAFGVESFRAAIDRGLDLAHVAEQELERLPGWEIVTPANMAIVTFRFVDAPEHQLNDINRRITEGLSRDGFAFLSTTQLRGRTVLRFCTINPRTSDEDIRETIRRLDEIKDEVRNKWSKSPRF